MFNTLVKLVDTSTYSGKFFYKEICKPQDFGEVVCHEIHASETRYGTVSYLRSINKNGKINCAFLFAKSRLRCREYRHYNYNTKITIPRLELQYQNYNTEIRITIPKLQYRD